MVVIRTGYMSLWPDAERMAAHKTAGPDISAARWLLERGVIATGTDTETYEVQPAPDPGPDGQPAARPHRCCSSRTASTSWRASISRSSPASASTSSCSSPCRVKIRGATGSMVDPVAVI